MLADPVVEPAADTCPCWMTSEQCRHVEGRRLRLVLFWRRLRVGQRVAFADAARRDGSSRKCRVASCHSAVAALAVEIEGIAR